MACNWIVFAHLLCNGLSDCNVRLFLVPLTWVAYGGCLHDLMQMYCRVVLSRTISVMIWPAVVMPCLFCQVCFDIVCHKHCRSICRITMSLLHVKCCLCSVFCVAWLACGLDCLVLLCVFQCLNMWMVGFVEWCKHDGHGLHLKKAKSQAHGIMVDHKGLGTRI